ncbi:OmpA family protein [Roseomonas sp. 18066]|uniref:OmpA family protein n=1 Tax=Roseomonas sp. 18066 TaxID=2681412 RepID=UPI00135785C2|nr:OmpA family protein [Roseomonas sp. 18066]
MLVRVAALLLLPAVAVAQPLSERPSTFREAALPAPVWRPYAMPDSRFAPRAAESRLTPAPAESSFRLREVESRLRPRTEALLTALGAEKAGDTIRIALPGDVLFDFDRAEIRADARPVLAQLTEILRAYARSPVEIQGHTDSHGSDGYNQALSERRAAAVRLWLQRQGVAAARLRTIGYGEARPVVPNARPDGGDDPAGRQRNRRVEFIIHPAPPG